MAEERAALLADYLLAVLAMPPEGLTTWGGVAKDITDWIELGL